MRLTPEFWSSIIATTLGGFLSIAGGFLALMYTERVKSRAQEEQTAFDMHSLMTQIHGHLNAGMRTMFSRGGGNGYAPDADLAHVRSLALRLQSKKYVKVKALALEMERAADKAAFGLVDELERVFGLPPKDKTPATVQHRTPSGGVTDPMPVREKQEK